MRKCLGFIDGSGNITHDTQTVFGRGLLKLTSVVDYHLLREELEKIRERARNRLGQTRENFEFKWYKVGLSNIDYYKEFIEKFVIYNNSFHALIYDKHGKDLHKSWGAYYTYFEHSRRLIKKYVSKNERIYIIADADTKPEGNTSYEEQMGDVHTVINTEMLKSQKSVFLQMVDVLTGAICYDFRKERGRGEARDKNKLDLLVFIKEKVNLKTFVPKIEGREDYIEVHNPNHFSVKEYLIGGLK